MFYFCYHDNMELTRSLDFVFVDNEKLVGTFLVYDTEQVLFVAWVMEKELRERKRLKVRTARRK